MGRPTAFPVSSRLSAVDAETLKALGTGSAQFVLAAGYLPVFWLVKTLWTARDTLQDKILAMLDKQYADADGRKTLWDAQRQVIEGQSTAIKDLSREVMSLRADIQRGKP